MTIDYTSDPSGLPFVQHVYKDFTPELQWSRSMFIGIVLNGSITIQYQNRTRNFTTHDIYFCLPLETFATISSQEDAKMLALSVDADFITKMIPDLSMMSLRQHHIGCDLRNQIYFSICRDFSTIIFNNLKNETGTRLKMLEAITHILITLFENYSIRQENATKTDYATERVSEILDYINRHYTEKISVHDIARDLGIHPQYFSTFFKKHFQSGFNEYLAAFRVNTSLDRLLHTDDSILDIALDSGFSNHKTYAAAFRKLYGAAPLAYRKDARAVTASPDGQDDADTADEGVFAFFRQFTNADNTDPIDTTQNKMQRSQVLSFDAARLGKCAFVDHRQSFFTVGRASACLRSDLQQHLIQASRDIHIDYYRIRDIFADDIYVYHEDRGKKPIFNWLTLDHVFDFILSLGGHPFPEIGFMPQKLASKKQYAGLQFRPNVSMPKSDSAWKTLIRNFLTHCISRYGADEVTQWYFDFWCDPDLQLQLPYWYDSMEDFFRFYRMTYEVFAEVDPRLRLGSPTFSTISGFPWYDAFFKYCRAHHMEPAYISAHIYGCAPQSISPITGDYYSVKASEYSITNQDQLSEYLATLQRIMDANGFGDREIIVSDFNLNFMPSDLIRDTCYMGAYLAYTTFQTMRQVKSLCYWCLSDIHEESFVESGLFHGSPGILNAQGLKKASYNCFVLLSRLGKNIIDRGKNYLLAKKGDVYQLFIYNLVPFDSFFANLDQSALDITHRYHIYSNDEDLRLGIFMQLPKGSYYIKKYEVNRNYGSAYDIWGQIGYPETLSQDLEDYLCESSVPHVTYTVHNVDTTLVLDEIVPAHGVMLLEIMKKQ